jgi:hypothetical protein
MCFQFFLTLSLFAGVTVFSVLAAGGGGGGELSHPELAIATRAVATTRQRDSLNIFYS